MRKQVHLPIVLRLNLTGCAISIHLKKACVMLRAASNPIDLK
jgi:hypothetical protein